jgi:type III restriction enzyme
MELKEYQQSVLSKLDRYLAVLGEMREEAVAYAEFQRSRGKEAGVVDWCSTTWEKLNQEKALPLLSVKGLSQAAGWLSRRDGLGRPIPNVCLKVPTGGGKTLLATAALERIQTDFLKRQTGLVLWVVPSEAIYRQTWKHLANREHPYRQMLERASGGRVKMLEKADAFTKRDVEERLCVMLLMLPSASRKTKETLRLFRDSGRFTSFFPVEDDAPANAALLEKMRNLDCNDLADMGWAQGIPPGSVSLKQSLGNVLRLVRPVVVIDEGHKAYSDTARDTLGGFNPVFMLELSATPNTNGKHQSNVLVNVPGAALKDEEMIKLPINVINEEKGDWKQTLALTASHRDALEKEAEKYRTASGRYIRPLALVRVERTGKDQRDAGYVHAEDVREYLQDKLGIPEEHIRLKTSETDELGSDDLLVETCEVRWIITKDALREGWDCPFAYLLAVLSRTTATTALTQMVGRVLRQPYARRTGMNALDECYVFTFDQDVNKAVEGVRKGLEDEGMADLASYVKATEAGSGKARNLRKETLRRREAFRKLSAIFLPRVLHKDDSVPEGWRALDYERDILGDLDWAALRFLSAGDLNLEEGKRLERTVARINLGPGDDADGKIVLELERKEVTWEENPNLDVPFLVRQLTDVVPNPWQASRILSETLETLRAKGVSEPRLYTNRLELLKQMKQELGEVANKRAERLFKDKLSTGVIRLRLVSSNDPHLNWQLAETLEIEVSDADVPLRRRNGSEFEKSLFEKVYQRDFNELEKNTAWYLDEEECVYWWHRIAVGRASYGLQGWQRHKVYPDLLACIHQTESGKFRFTVLETKGEHLKGNDDTDYKRTLFDLLTLHSGGDTRFVGELDLDGLQENPIQFQMVMENTAPHHFTL